MKDEALRLALEALQNSLESPIWRVQCDQAITAIKQALEQPEGEPVIFYRCKGCDTAYEEAHPTSCDCMEDKGFERIEYFTSPPKREWQGLLYQDRNKIRGNYWLDIPDKVFDGIEAKLKEKNT